MSKNVLQLTRAAYHLGNRHIPTQLGAGYLAYLHDHVIDDMIRRLGLEVTVVNAPFEPEAGAYGHGAIHSHHGGAHSHSHDDAPTHDHPGAATA